MLVSDYDYWQRIYGRRPYDTEQLQVADILTNFVEKLYPGIRQEIEVTDVATPISYERYTGNWLGSSSGWLLTKQTMRLMISGMSKTLPGLGNFFLAGQWVEPGGMVPQAAMSGRNAIQLLCHADGRPFVTSVTRPTLAFASP
jgi:phytoene dehydrogenase-like protein